MIEIIKGTWAAGETKTFVINGEYLELLDAQYPCDVFLMNQVGAQLSVMRDCEASFFSKPSGGFATVQITSAQAQFLRFFVGSGDAGTRRISSTVQVVDGGRARTLANSAFMGAVGKTLLAANNTHVQLWNPVGSGKNVIVKAYSVGATSPGGINLGFNTAALATLQNQGVSKMGGGAAAAAQLRAENSTTNYFVGSTSDSFYVQAVVSIQRVLQEPLVIAPGRGFVASVGAVDLTCVFEWVEEAI